MSLPVNIPKTKIIATIGPTSWDDGVFMRMVNAGMAVARINASFADDEEIRRVTAQVRRLAPHVAVLLDTKGHKIRLCDFPQEAKLERGQTFSLFTRKVDWGVYVVTDAELQLDQQVPVGSTVLIDDGLISLKVIGKQEAELQCEVVQGGVIKRMKTVSIPGVHIDFGGISTKDHHDIMLARELKIDIVSASFMRNADDVREVKELLQNSSIAVVSKIEDQEGVDNFAEILELSDGIMVARGDLSLDVQPERVPILQKKFIKTCNVLGKPVVVATQMLQSMVENIMPTRAEVSDVANAIYDGADAIMLSAESATGKNPAESVEMMARIAKEIESSLEPKERPTSRLAKPTTNAIAQAVYDACVQLPVDKVIVATGSGRTAQTIARFRLKQPIYAFTNDHAAKMRLTLSRGIVPDVIGSISENGDVGVKRMVRMARDRGYVQAGDLVVVVAGANVMNQGETNMLEINKVEHIIS